MSTSVCASLIYKHWLGILTNLKNLNEFPMAFVTRFSCMNMPPTIQTSVKFCSFMELLFGEVAIVSKEDDKRMNIWSGGC